MIVRKIEEDLLRFHKSSKKALLITGARQVGKTYTIKKFAEENYDSFVEIDFIENTKAVKVFKEITNSSDLLMKLSLLVNKPLIKGETLIFLDEVQVCPEIITAIKYLVDEGSYKYILSGSLLGVELKDIRSIPVGYMDVIEMYPMDFEEFLLSSGVSKSIIKMLEESYINKKTVDPFIHDKIMNLFNLYLIVGGMPAVVNKYYETNNIEFIFMLYFFKCMFQ